MTDTTAPARAGRRGRGARRDARTAYTQRYLPEMERGIPYMDALLPEQVDIVHDRTMRLLESTGIEFRDFIFATSRSTSSCRSRLLAT